MNVQNTYRPHARRNKNDVIIETVGDEVVIYDLKNQHCYALNPMSATIWDLCDGQTTLSEMVLLIKQAHKLSDEEATVAIDLSLEQLTQAGLLAENHPPMVQSEISTKRRTLLKRVAGMISLPAISSIVMQPAVAQLSGTNCNTPQCWSKFPCPGDTELCVDPDGKCSCVAVTGCGPQGVPCFPY